MVRFFSYVLGSVFWGAWGADGFVFLNNYGFSLSLARVRPIRGLGVGWNPTKQIQLCNSDVIWAVACPYTSLAERTETSLAEQTEKKLRVFGGSKIERNSANKPRFRVRDSFCMFGACVVRKPTKPCKVAGLGRNDMEEEYVVFTTVGTSQAQSGCCCVGDLVGGTNRLPRKYAATRRTNRNNN